MFLEATIKFWEDFVDEDGRDRRKKQDIHVLCHCISYSDAETLATEYGLELTSESFDIVPISELLIDDYYEEEGEDACHDNPWFKCQCVYAVITEKGKTKEYKRSILVQASDSAAASIRATEIMQKWADTKQCRTIKVSETKIIEILRATKKEE